MVYGDEHAENGHNIQDITFENVKVRLVKRTDWPKDLHDLRPFYEHPMIQEPMAVIYARYADGVRFHNFSYVIEDEMKEYVPEAVDVKECKDFVMR